MYRVVYSGEIAAGFEAATVIAAATQRMKASPSLMEKVFSGRKVVLKKGLNDKEGAFYIAELTKIGMRVSLERDPESVAAQEKTLIYEKKAAQPDGTTLLNPSAAAVAPIAPVAPIPPLVATKPATTANPAANPATTANPAANPAAEITQESLLSLHARMTATQHPKTSTEEDWAIASVHEYARMEDYQADMTDTDVNAPPFNHFPSPAEPVFREPPRMADSSPTLPASPMIFETTQHRPRPAAKQQGHALDATNAHAKLEAETQVNLRAFPCPHCGRMVVPPTADSSQQAHGEPKSPLGRLAAKISRFFG